MELSCLFHFTKTDMLHFEEEEEEEEWEEEEEYHDNPASDLLGR